MNNIKLKIALVEAETPAYRIAMKANINPSKVSKFISGLANPTDIEKRQLSKVLGKSILDLFPESEGVSA